MPAGGVFIYLVALLARSAAPAQLCGRPLGTGLHSMGERIVAGYDVGYYRYPWFVALMAQGVVACGGALVAPRAVLTAAHCFRAHMTTNKSDAPLEHVYTVMLGIYNKCKNESTQRAYESSKVIIHDKYKELGPYYDIALLILNGTTDQFEPICLPPNIIRERERPRDGTVPGLGTLKYHGATPCTLHEARMLIYSDLECRLMINRTGNDPSKITKSFCAGYLQGGIDTCQGDSGGPLQISDENGNYHLLGLVSFGFHCANPGLLGMYTDVSQYLDWIQDKSGGLVTSTSEAMFSVKTTTKTPKLIWPPIKIIIVRGKKRRLIRKYIKQYITNNNH